MGLGGQHHAPAALPPGKTRYPLYRWLGGPQGRSERVRKLSPPPGFDTRTVQPVASLYTDWVIPAQGRRSQDRLMLVIIHWNMLRCYVIPSDTTKRHSTLKRLTNTSLG